MFDQLFSVDETVEVNNDEDMEDSDEAIQAVID